MRDRNGPDVVFLQHADFDTSVAIRFIVDQKVAGVVVLSGLGELIGEFTRKGGHLFDEGDAVVLHLLASHVATGREHVTMFGDLGVGGVEAQRRRVRRGRDSRILRVLCASPVSNTRTRRPAIKYRSPQSAAGYKQSERTVFTVCVFLSFKTTCDQQI